jgi:hypothetical protein
MPTSYLQHPSLEGACSYILVSFAQGEHLRRSIVNS